LPFSDQRLQVRFEACTILTGMLKQQLDQSPLAGTKLPMDASARQSVQQRDGLLSQQLFQFFGGHVVPVKRSL
jgi:hypothetical protein